MINVVLQRPYRSVGGLLDISHVEFLVEKMALGQVFIRVFLLSVSFHQCSVLRAVTAEGQKS
jgi:hypothetical protein